MQDGEAKNTDHELWRRDPDNYYSPSIHVTNEGAIGIDVGGLVLVMSVEAWHKLAQDQMVRDDLSRN